MWATGFINCLIYFTILARFFVQFYGLFHDSTIGSTQFPKYLSILPLIFSSCPTYFMSVPVLSFNFQAISVKMYQSDTYIRTLHYITVHYITLHCITVHYSTLHCSTLHYITVQCITLHYITLRYVTLHYSTLHYITYIHTLHTYI